MVIIKNQMQEFTKVKKLYIKDINGDEEDSVEHRRKKCWMLKATKFAV